MAEIKEPIDEDLVNQTRSALFVGGTSLLKLGTYKGDGPEPRLEIRVF